MKNGKSPGTDGYTAEFYKFFWRDLGDIVLDSLNEAFTIGHLSHTQKQGIITLIPKPNKAREDLKNWRPITLLNVEHKLLSGLLAHRIKQVLPNIIGNDQKGFLKNRYIGENIRTVYDTLSYTKNKNICGMLLMVDFEKAFDSLEWDYLRYILEATNFGADFLQWFTVLYSNCNSCVINNVFFHLFFKIGRSCRQGDPLSPSLFILAVEPLANKIRESESIKGITIGTNTIKIGLYADDTFLVLDGSEVSLRESMQILKLFYECSGLRINVQKTKAIGLGKNKNWKILQKSYNVEWVTNFDLLGITFDLNLEKMLDINFNKNINEIEKVLIFYKKFKLSLTGKVNVLKTLAIPKIVYSLTVLPNPGSHVLTRIEKLFQDFLWGSSTVKIANGQLEKDLSEGGLKLLNITNFNHSVKTGWIKRLVQSSGTWQNIFEQTICPCKKLTWELDIDSLTFLEKTTAHQFWADVLSSWKYYKEMYSKEIDVRT